MDDHDSDAEAGHVRAFYGRRKGKRLRPGQEERLADLLPRLRLPEAGRLDPSALFPRPVSETWLEIGFGGGEHLAAQARLNPGTGIIGCEPFVNGVVKLLRTVDEEGLDTVRFWDRDAMELLPRLPDASIGRVFLLYPDPWPKRRQRKRRFVSDEALGEIARVLVPGGEFRFASDIDDYVGWTLVRAARCPALRWTAARSADWTTPWPEWPGTRYEAKTTAEGRRPSYLTFVRV
ncbi:tRNA (guanine(46)-N(7))-methyltransferase TrmB [Methylobacterium platani]|uniref:tRNA (guanine-N(7)-)-methyltransferase n=2 Tax=Methylobacterium platani TaxID=427683 RepID=A0A179S6M0_9HYPH|nr:tRNA (guanine(46)-N(7))-methyltransferase TrmB [Methylobacterium platani]KMO11263.1 tRNA (guanine-N7)-methyltransferase [Methylobacterium platani JCM 14648]OAS22470.1 tRNA (guanosine(46)-N7)-methyltransferase TrmB [Methylobacterium platani]